MYEESFQMPFLIQCPNEISRGSVCDDIICNADFAPHVAGLRGPEETNIHAGRELPALAAVPITRGLAAGRAPLLLDARRHHPRGVRPLRCP